MSDKVSRLKEKIAALEVVIADFDKKKQELRRELVAAEKECNIGRKVQVVETCKRGCCIEREYTGTIESVQGNYYKIRISATETGEAYQDDVRFL